MTTNVLGSGADNLVIDGGVLQYNDLGGADRYTISPELAGSGVTGPIVVNDTSGGVINLPVGLGVDSVSFASSGVQMTIGGIVVQFVGTTNYSVNVGGNPLVSNAGNLLTLAEFAQSLGTTVPASGVGAPVNGGTVQADGTLGGNPPTGADAVLTAGTDVLTGNVFEAGLVFTPGGNDRVNALQDEDVLTGTGDAPTLNATLGNANDNGGVSLTPTFNGIEVFNVAFTGNNSAGPQGNAAVNRLDLQDSTDSLTDVNVTRITTTVSAVQIDNMPNVPANLSVSNTSDPTATVGLHFLNGVATAGDDSTTLTVSNVNASRGGISVEQSPGPVGVGGSAIPAPFVSLNDGVETMSLVSTGAANAVGVLSAEDLQELNISGDARLSLGAAGVINRVAGGNQVEAFAYAAGLNNVNGSLTSVDASGLSESLSINLGTEVTSLTDGSSGNKVDFSFVGTAQDDVVRLINGTDTNGDNIDGGAGADVLQVFASVANGTFTALETLDIRGQNGGTITVDAARFTGLEQLMIRNEGQVGAAPAAVAGASTNAPLNTTLTNLDATQFAGIRLQHSNTGNNALTDNLIVASLAADGGNDTVAVTYADQLDGESRGINQDARFNFELQASNAENVTINDNDSESNTVDLGTGAGTFGTPQNTDVQAHSGTVDLNGGLAGQFLNLDATANAYRYEANGSPILQGAPRDGGTVLAGTAGDRSDIGAGSAERFIAATIDATDLASNLVVRVSDSNDALGGQTILGGTGNDTFIFDQIAGGAVNRRTAGLTISDTVNGGDGTDILGIDGDGVNVSIGASEWTNVSNIEILRPIGNNSQEAFGNGRGQTNAYNLTLTNDLLANNGTAAGSIKRITIVNDNDGSNDIVSNASAGADDTGANNALFGLTGVESGITIDARTLDANNSFVYNGEEGASNTADRFIFADPNINGTAVIDGGRIYGALNAAGRQTVSNLANADVIEVRNGAVVSLGDIGGIRNVGAFEFTNDTATAQTSVLSLNNETVDRLVNDGRNANSANVETLNISAFNNANVANAVTHLTVDSSTVTTDAFGLNFNTQGGNDLVLIDAAASGPAVVANLGANTGIATDVNGGVDTVELRNGVNGETYAINGAGNLTITSANGQVVREVILSGVERVDITNLNNLNAAQKAALVAANPIFFDGSGGGVVPPPPPPPGFTAVNLPEGAGALQAVNGVNGTAEDFQLDVVAARGQAPDTQINLASFLVAEDQLTLDLPVASGVTTLDQLNGVQGIAVQADPFNAAGASTLVNLGPDADGNVIALTLLGVVDATQVNVNVI